MDWFSLEDPNSIEFKKKYCLIDDYNEYKEKMNEEMAELNTNYNELQEDYVDTVEEYDDFQKEYKNLNNKLNKFKNTLVEKKKQVAKSMKKGQPTKKVYAHSLLKHSISDVEIQEFISDNLKVPFDNVYYQKETENYLENRIFYTYNALQSFRHKRYKTDEQANGHQEYRESADEVWALIKKDKYSDCDFWAVLFWIVLDYVVRQVNIDNNLIYCADVIVGGIGHAILTYNKEGIFIPLETTMNNKTYSDLIKNTRINASYQTTLLLVFDDKTEYVLD